MLCVSVYSLSAMPTCTQCQSAFPDPSTKEKELYEKLAVEEPTTCNFCSEQRRFAFRNELTCYKRTCDATGKNIVSIYSPDSPYTVYEREEWLSDRYNPLDYGREYDFSKGFFEQFKELSLAVPYEHMVIINSENCDYCNMIADSRNCYLSVRIIAEDVSYCFLVFGHSKDCIDCHSIESCELCYECIDCINCHSCKWSQRCKQCTDCTFCIDCTGCQNCFGCTGLTHKEYHFFNEPLSKEQYKEKMQEWNTSSYETVERAKNALREIDQKRPQRFAWIEQSENAEGDYISKSRNIIRSFDVMESEDIIDSYGMEFTKDMARSSHQYHAELGYEFLSSVYAQSIRFCYGCYNSHDIEYCMMVHQNSHDCFGCVGLKKSSYCILNKEYSEDAYRELRDKIVEKMKVDGEYGQFFPPDLSHFAYNETYAQQVYPLTKEEAIAKGFRWKDNVDEPLQTEKTIAAERLPDLTEDTPDDVLNWAIVCRETGKAFKLTKKELEFYREQNVPIPRIHHQKRHLDRAARRRPQKLWERTCDKCRSHIKTTFDPSRPEVVYCETCYLAEVY